MPAVTPTSPAVTPMAFVRALLLAYQRYGLDPGPALRHAGIDPGDVPREDARITAAQMESVCGHAMQELDDEALGWFSRKLPWGSYGMLCRGSITAPSLEVALKRWCRHHRLLVDDIRLHLEVASDVATLSIEERVDLGAMREFCLVTLLRYVNGYACWLIDSRIPLLQSRFPYPEPAHGDAYGVMFPGEVQFGAPTAAIRFDAHYLDLPLRRDEAALRTMLRRALPLTVLQYRRDRLLLQRVRGLLRARPDELGTAEALAAAMHVSARSLHRHLADEGASLQQIKDEVRREQAIDLLTRTGRPVKQIAHAVGFTNDKSFARAFKSWTGLAPSDFRRLRGLPGVG